MPSLVSISPAAGTRDFPIDGHIVLTFSAPVRAGAGAITFFSGANPLAIDIHSNKITIAGNTVTVDVDLLSGQDYSISINAGWVQNVDGNAQDYFHGAGLSSAFSTGYRANAVNQTGTAEADILPGSTSADVIRGGAGHDFIEGYDGNDRLSGDDGNDTLNGGAGDDVLDGGDGNDRLYSSQMADGAFLRGGNDTLYGGAGDDDLLLYDPDNGVAYGGDGNDKIQAAFLGAAGTAAMDGGGGDDVLVVNQIGHAGAGVTMTGSWGRDTFLLLGSHAGSAHVVTDFQPGEDIIDLTNIPALQSWSHGNPLGASGYLRMQQQGVDTVIWIDDDGAAGTQASWQPLLRLKNVALSSLRDRDFTDLLRLDGRDTGAQLQGTAGNDQLTGTLQNDQLSGGAGDDTLTGKSGDDALDGGTGDDLLFGGLGDDRLVGGDGNDWFGKDGMQTEGDDTLDGGEGDDHLVEAAGNNTINGGPGNDDITLINGVNHVFGGAGRDVISVGNGTAVIDGGDGNDTIRTDAYFLRAPDITATGGGGRDRYEFTPQLTHAVTITDFAAGAGGDLLDPFTLFDGLRQSNLFLTGHLRLQQSGNDTWLQFDPDGANGSEDFRTAVVLRNTRVESLTNDNFAQGIHPSGTSQGETFSGDDRANKIDGGFQDDVIDGDGGNDVLNGGNGNDTISGGDGDDQVDGGSGNDTIDGGNGNDTLFGGEGNNILRGGAGNDILVSGYGNGNDNDIMDGGAGIDTGQFDHAYQNYLVTVSKDAIRVTLVHTDHVTTYTGVERLLFRDMWGPSTGVAYDVDGNAGKVYRLYKAAYDRKPDDQGFSFWLQHADKGLSMTEIGKTFTQSQEFRDLYGAAPTNADFVTRLYHNVLHREPEADGYTYWLNVLNEQRATQAELLNIFAESKENTDALAQLIGNGIVYQHYYF